MKRWNTITDNDRGLIPLFECLTYVFRALGRAAQSFALPVFTRCINVVDVAKGGVTGDKYDPELSDFVTCSLDLMCSLTEALGAGLDPLVVSRSNSGSTLLQLLFACMSDKRQEVRQSAFALVGEFARAGLPSLIPVMKDYVEAVIEALSPDYMLVANNATWALGELVMMAGFLPSGIPIDRQAIQKPLLDRALPTLVRIVNIPQLSKSLLENAAMTLGRLGLVMPDAVAPKLESFAEAALAALRNVPDHADKEQAFFGLNAMIKLNPTAILRCFVYYVDGVASWLHVNPKLEAEFGTILVGYKNSLGDQWQTLQATFPPPLQTCLLGRFNL
jgi:transportin-1